MLFNSFLTRVWKRNWRQFWSLTVDSSRLCFLPRHLFLGSHQTGHEIKQLPCWAIKRYCLKRENNLYSRNTGKISNYDIPTLNCSRKSLHVYTFCLAYYLWMANKSVQSQSLGRDCVVAAYDEREDRAVCWVQTHVRDLVQRNFDVLHLYTCTHQMSQGRKMCGWVRYTNTPVIISSMKGKGKFCTQTSQSSIVHTNCSKFRSSDTHLGFFVNDGDSAQLQGDHNLRKVDRNVLEQHAELLEAVGNNCISLGAANLLRT